MYINPDLAYSYFPTIGTIQGYLRKADRKFADRDPRPLMSMLLKLNEADNYLLGLTHKRKTGPKSLKWDIRLPLEFKLTPAEEKQLAETKTRFRRAQIIDIFEDIIDGILYGMSNVRLTWDNTKYGTMVVHKETTDLTELDFSEDDDMLFFLTEDKKGDIIKTPIDPDINLTTRFNPIKNKKYYLGSYMRSALVLAFLKYNSRWDWRDLLKRHGVPGTYITHPEGIDDKDIKKLIDMAEKLKNDAVAVFPEYVKVLYEQALKSDSTDSFDKFISAINKELAILIHGQNLTTEVNGGSRAAASIHNEIDDLIIIGEDVDMIKKVITNQYLKQDYLLNYGEPRNDFFELVLVEEEQEDFESNSRVIANLFSEPELKNKFPLKKSEVYAKLGFTPPAKDDEVI